MDIDDLARLLPFIILVVLWLSKLFRKKENPAGSQRRSPRRSRRKPQRNSPGPDQQPEFKRDYEPIEPR